MSLTTMDAELLSHFNQTAATERNARAQDANASQERERRQNALEAVFKENPSDASIIQQVKEMFYTARAHRRPMVERWNRSYRMLRNRFWDDNVRPDFLPSPAVPEIFPIVRSTVGWMTDRRFHNTVSVAAAPFTDFYSYYNGIARDLETVLDSTWHVNNEEAEVTISLWDAYTYGTGILKTTWDNTLAGGMGDAKIARIDTFGFYPDPSARNLTDGNYYLEVKNMSLQELDRRFPGAYAKFEGIGDYLESVDEAPNQMVNTGPVPRGNVGSLNGRTVALGAPGRAGISRRNRIDDLGVTVFEAWVREHEVYTVDVIDPEWQNMDPETRGKPKTIKEQHVFDTWRVYVVAGNYLLLNAKAEDIWSHGQHPYSRFVPHDLGEFWGIGLVELLTPSQTAINRLLAAAMQNIELSGNPIWMEDAGANTQRTALTNQPGKRVTKGRGEIKWMEPPHIQPDIPGFLQYFLARMESVSGLAAITKGKEPSGRPAEGTMDAVQEAAFVGIRLALRSLERTMRDAGYKKASLIVENYTVPRIVAITGNSGERTTLALRARHFMLPTAKGASPLQYQLLVDLGSGSDTSRKVREDKAITLFTLGALDLMSLYDALDWPNKEEVFNRVIQQMQSGLFQPPGQRQRARK